MHGVKYRDGNRLKTFRLLFLNGMNKKGLSHADHPSMSDVDICLEKVMRIIKKII